MSVEKKDENIVELKESRERERESREKVVVVGVVVGEKKEILLTDREERERGRFRSVFGAAAGGWRESGGRAFSEAD